MSHKIMTEGMGNVGARFNAFINLAEAHAQNYEEAIGEAALEAASWYEAGIASMNFTVPTTFKGLARFRNSLFALAQEGIEHDVEVLGAYPSWNVLSERGVLIPGDDTVSRLSQRGLVSGKVREAFMQSSRALFGTEPGMLSLSFQLSLIEQPIIYLDLGNAERFNWATGNKFERYPGQRWDAIRQADEREGHRWEARSQARSALAQRVDHDEKVLATLNAAFDADKPLAVHPRYLFDGVMLGEETGTFQLPDRTSRPMKLQATRELQERMAVLITDRDQLVAALQSRES